MEMTNNMQLETGADMSLEDNATPKNGVNKGFKYALSAAVAVPVLVVAGFAAVGVVIAAVNGYNYFIG